VSSTAVARAVNVLAQLLGLLFAVVFTIKGYEFTAGSIETMPFLFMSKKPWYAAMPICGTFMIVYAMVGVIRAIAGRPVELALQ
jgi:TRAP-type C4-dicarboxylate transport system permease small subunit